MVAAAAWLLTASPRGGTGRSGVELTYSAPDAPTRVQPPYAEPAMATPRACPAPGTCGPAVPNYDGQLSRGLDSLGPGRVLFQAPAHMTVGRDDAVNVRISDSLAVDLTEGLRGVGVAQWATITVGPDMSAILSSDQSAFRITVLSDPEQLVPDGGVAYWTWNVTPLHPGIEKLFLSVVLHVYLGEENVRRDLPVFQAAIQVDLDPGEAIGSLLSQYGLGAGTLLLGIATLVLGSGGLVLRARRQSAGSGTSTASVDARQGGRQASRRPRKR
jgi:hypothetical protein